jgi:TonB family protein
MIRWQVYAIALVIFASRPPAASMAQSIRPKITDQEKAKYTKEARDNYIHGTVALSVVLGSDGTIFDFKVVNGLPYGLTESAIIAAKKVRFEPGTKDGQPVSVRVILMFGFQLYDLDEKGIRRVLRNDFPVLSEGTTQLMAAKIYKRGNTGTEEAWRFGQQCLENGPSKLPQSEQEELTNLKLEAIQALEESDQQYYQRLQERSKIERLPDYLETQIIEFLCKGISRLPDEQRKRAEALYNKAATLETEIP